MAVWDLITSYCCFLLFFTVQHILLTKIQIDLNEATLILVASLSFICFFLSYFLINTSLVLSSTFVFAGMLFTLYIMFSTPHLRVTASCFTLVYSLVANISYSFHVFGLAVVSLLIYISTFIGILHTYKPVTLIVIKMLFSCSYSPC